MTTLFVITITLERRGIANAATEARVQAPRALPTD